MIVKLAPCANVSGESTCGLMGGICHNDPQLYYSSSISLCSIMLWIRLILYS